MVSENNQRNHMLENKVPIKRDQTNSYSANDSDYYHLHLFHFFAKTLGYKDGYDIGHEEGYKEAYEEGKKQGYKEGKEDGRQTGYRQGYSAGQTNTRTCPMCLGRGVQAHFSCNGQGCSLCGNTSVEKCIHCNGRGFTYY
ncbi:MAG TPA: hypothetical protein PLP97_07230 [Prevotella sp.]|nr:hypothetical protein [Prevotella sp.]